MSHCNYKDLLTIAIPATLESLFVVLITIFDTNMVSPLGTAAISAVAVATQPKLVVFLVFTSLGTATTVVVSRLYGERDQHRANAVLSFSVLVALVGSIVLGALIVVLAWPIMIVCSNQQDTMEMSVAFLRILMAGMVFQAMSTSMNAAMRGIGQVKATLASSVTNGVVDIIFNYLLIEGHFGFPAWGVSGAATATSLGCVAAFIVSTGFLMRKSGFLSLHSCIKSGLHIDRADMRDIGGKLGNVFCENILTRIGFLFSGMVVARLGSYETSIYSVGTQLLSLSFAFGDGIQTAILALVGKSVGAKDTDSCADYIRYGVRTGLGVSVVAMAACVSLGGWFYSLFNTSADFCAAGGVVSVFVAAIIPFQVTRLVRVSALRAFGDMKTPRRIATISVLILDPPLSLLFAWGFGMGQWGLWIGTLISQVAWFAMAEVFSRRAQGRLLAGVEQ